MKFAIVISDQAPGWLSSGSISSMPPPTTRNRALLRRFLATISVGAAIALVIHWLRRRLVLKAPILVNAREPPAGEPPAEPSQPLPARMPPPVTRLASRRGSLVSPDAGEPWKLKGRYAAFLSHYKVSSRPANLRWATHLQVS